MGYSEFENIVNKAKQGGKAFSVEYAGGEMVFVNATPHELRFDDGSTVKGNPELAQVLSAGVEEREITRFAGIVFVSTEFIGLPEGYKLVAKARDAGNVFLIGSIIAAQAYRFPVISPITTPETARKPPDQKVCYKNKWNCYP